MNVRAWFTTTGILSLYGPPRPLVFTLPSELSSLALGNRKQLYNLLLQSAWDSTKKKVESELGLKAVGCGVLHTWNQRLGHHPHVHMLVAGSGPSVDGKKWIGCRMTSGGSGKKAKPFLVGNDSLGKLFRDMFLRRLKRILKRGEISVVDRKELDSVLVKLSQIQWNVFIEGPPKDDCSATQVLKYLTRYMNGGPISDKRIIGERDGRVYFYVRNKDQSGEMVRHSLRSIEFVQQWSLHILPKGFQRSRFFGGWSGAQRMAYQEQIEQLMRSKQGDSKVTYAQESVRPMARQRCCPRCAGELIEVESVERPSWWALNQKKESSPASPNYDARVGEKTEMPEERGRGSRAGPIGVDWIANQRGE